MRTHPFLRLDHRTVEQLGQHNVAVKNAGAVLVGNAQRIPETPRCHQQCGLAFALQQGVGGHGGSHLHALHHIGRNWLTGLQTQQVANAGHGRVAVLLWTFAQQLVRDQRAVRALAHHIGESTAAVDPELPA